LKVWSESGELLQKVLVVMREGSLEQPVRYPIDWQNESFYDEQALDLEMRRVFDICHGCRRCFNLCSSFPTLFDLVDATQSGEVDEVDSKDFNKVVDGCTLCDLCFVNKCPYVPPHDFNVDFPHLMLRYRAVNNKKSKLSFEKLLRTTDVFAKFAAKFSIIINKIIGKTNTIWRKIIAATAKLSQEVYLPQYANKTLCNQLQYSPVNPNKKGRAYGQEIALFATCFGNYHNPSIGVAAAKILALQGYKVTPIYPGCCGMPLFEVGDLNAVAVQATKISGALKPYLEKQIPIISIVPSCSFMLKSEWPLLLPENALVKQLADNVWDICEFIVHVQKTIGLHEGIKALPQKGATLHLACHSRAQNIGAKAAEMLRLIPDLNVQIIEKCSGHGGLWGMLQANFQTALKFGKATSKQVLTLDNPLIMSECPLALKHIMQGMEKQDADKTSAYQNMHPVEVLAKAYGFC
jgi:glycerol-3-phosphate dehydrogenase subunit C